MRIGQSRASNIRNLLSGSVLFLTVFWAVSGIAQTYHSASVQLTANTHMLADASGSLDGDAVPDIWEMRQFGALTYVNDTSDFDGDHVTDNAERLAGTDPKNPSDHPGIPGEPDSIDDNWEMQYFGDLSTADDTTDWDHDGILDKDEFQAGTHPKLLTESALEVAGLRMSPGRQMVIEWPTSGETNPAPRYYVLLRGTNLAALIHNPEAIATNIPGDGSNRSSTNNLSLPAGYYSIKAYVGP